MASVATWITLQIVLMFWLGLPEWTGLRDFSHNLPGPQPGGLDLRDSVACNPLLFLARVENRRTIARSLIVSLTVQRGRVVDLEKEFQKLPITELLRVKNDLDRFGMCSVIAVRCIGDVATRIADTRRDYTRVPAQQILHTPEAAAGKNGSFSGHITYSILLLMLGTVAGSGRILRFRADRKGRSVAKRN